MISVFGSTGFVGGKFCEMYPDEVIRIPREDNQHQSADILYLISTTDNYNVYDKPTLDIETNLIKLMKVLEQYRKNPIEDQVFNFVSSWFVLGDVPLPAKEDAYCNPKGIYSISKRTAEQMLISY